MSIMAPIGGLPGVRSPRSVAHRIVFRDGVFDCELSGGKVIDGTLSRDQGNTGDVDVLRAGKLMGKVTSSGKYAPSVLGVTGGAYSGGTSLTVSSAAAAEIVRRIGATGTFKIAGPPSAGGALAVETVTYSAVSGTTVTITALTNAYVSGSLILPTDGSENMTTLIPDGHGVKVTDVDGTSQDTYFDRLPIGGVILASQIVDWPSDTALRAFIVGRMNTQGMGKFVFDHLY